ncbi:hypothetical protein [Pseudoxanthomonas yeongjuensis]|nr:hypothetical protein [Pseudoxanthomonas yeongjuensis]
MRAIPEWGTDSGFEQKTKYWRPRQQAQMRALFAEWRSRHPIAAG